MQVVHWYPKSVQWESIEVIGTTWHVYQADNGERNREPQCDGVGLSESMARVTFAKRLALEELYYDTEWQWC